MNTSIHWLSVFGTALNLAAAIWIAKALAFSSDRALLDQAATRWDVSQFVLQTLEHQRIDTRCGLGILAAGFGMQLAALLVPHASLVWSAGAALVTLAVAFGYDAHRRVEEDSTRGDRVAAYILETGRIPD